MNEPKKNVNKISHYYSLLNHHIIKSTYHSRPTIIIQLLTTNLGFVFNMVAKLLKPTFPTTFSSITITKPTNVLNTFYKNPAFKHNKMAIFFSGGFLLKKFVFGVGFQRFIFWDPTFTFLFFGLNVPVL